MDDVIDALKSASSCDHAMAIFTACAFNTSGDLRFGDIVTHKCELGFLGRLKSPRKLRYRSELGICDRKYRDEDGTMYRSFEAFCRAEVAQRYAHEASRSRSAR